VISRVEKLRLDQIQSALDPIEAIMHSVETPAHLRHFPAHVRDAALDGAEAAPLLALFIADFSKLVADSPEMFESQVWRLFSHGGDYGVAPASAHGY
jgi:hypothetical protein